MDWLRRKSATAFSVVVPGATPMRLPARSATVLRPDPSAISRLAPSTNVMSVKSTFSCRDSEAVVEPHSMSTVPLTTASTRFSGVTGTHFTARFASLSSCWTATAISWQRSIE